MTIRFKLTDQKDQTRNGTQWGPGVKHITDGQGDLCGPGWIHVYKTPLLAVLHNPIHGNLDLDTAHIWICECDGVNKTNGDLKEGWTEVTTIERIELPVVTLTQRIAYVILCAREVCENPRWLVWADNWLSGKDRTEAGATSVRKAVWAATVRVGAEEAATVAEWAAGETEREAEGRRSRMQAMAKMVARAVALTVAAAEMRNNKIDLLAIAKRAMKIE